MSDKVIGPLGLCCSSEQAFALESILKQIDPNDRRIVRKELSLSQAPEILTDRSEISWISTEDIDQDQEVVLAAGMDDAFYKLNPVVLLNHDRDSLPVGTSVWRRHVRDHRHTGVKACTKYPAKPEDCTLAEWPPDVVWAAIKTGLIKSKSIGFVALSASSPTREEIKSNPAWERVKRVIRKWMLLEYSLVTLPAQPNATVETVGKGMQAGIPEGGRNIAFTSWEEIQRRIDAYLSREDVQRRIKEEVQRHLQHLFDELTRQTHVRTAHALTEGVMQLENRKFQLETNQWKPDNPNWPVDPKRFLAPIEQLPQSGNIPNGMSREPKFPTLAEQARYRQQRQERIERYMKEQIQIFPSQIGQRIVDNDPTTNEKYGTPDQRLHEFTNYLWEMARFKEGYIKNAPDLPKFLVGYLTSNGYLDTGASSGFRVPSQPIRYIIDRIGTFIKQEKPSQEDKNEYFRQLISRWRF